MKYIKKIAVIFVLVSLALFVSACDRRGNKNELVYVHSWTAEGLGGHFFSGADMGPVSWYVVEGFGDFLRTLDYVYYTTAESITHFPDSTSIVTLRDDVYWQHSNDRFVADDVLAYYYLNTGSITKYLFDIIAVDDEHVKFVWNPEVEPNDEVKTLLLVTDRVATVPYRVFKQWADICISINKESPYADSFDGLPKFGRVISDDDNIRLIDAYNEYKKFKPEYFPATGPYEIKAYDANEMILKKNESWYNRDKVGFESIKLINNVGDTSLFSSMVINGLIDLWLNTPPRPVVENILASNPDIAFYKVPSPFSHGVKFNMQKTELWRDQVRLAFQYILDRDEIRKLSSFYSTTSWTTMSGMNDTDTKMWMSQPAYEEYIGNYRYRFDLDEAERLLKAAGWSRKSGKWYNQNNKLVELVIGYDGSNAVPSSVAEAMSAQLMNFGITTNLKRASGYPEFYATATQNNSPYDLVCDNTAYNGSYNYPSAAFTELYYSGVGATANLKYFKDETLNGFNGRLFKPADYIDKMLCLSPAKLTEAVDDLILGLARKNVGINIYQEASGGLYNTAKISGLPFPEYLSENRDIQYMPAGGTEDHIKALFLILFYDHGSALYNGMLYPKQ